MAKTIQFITKGKTDQVSTVSTGAGAPLIVHAQKGANYELRDINTHRAPQQILVKRRGKDLLIKLEVSGDLLDGNAPADVIIKGYYDAKGQLIGIGEDGQYHNMVPQSANSIDLPSQMADGQSAYESLGYSQEHTEAAVVWWPYLLGALAIGGIAAAVAGSGGGDDNNNDTISLSAQLSPNSDSGRKGDNLSNDATPAFVGTGEPGSVIQLTIDGRTYTTTVNSNGNWTVTATNQLTDGNYAVTVVQTDTNGDETTTSLQVAIDTIPPELYDFKITETSDSGVLGDFITNDTTPTLEGKGEPGAAITVKINGETLTTTVDASGKWSVTPTIPLPDSPNYPIEVIETDAAGNQSHIFPGITISTESALSARLDPSSDSDPKGDGITNDTTPTISGTAEAGSSIRVDINGEILNTVADENGVWSVTAQVPLANGNYIVNVRAIDTDGNTITKAVPIEIDSTIPEAIVTITGISEDSGIVGDFITNDNDGLTINATLSTSLTPNEKLMYSLDGGVAIDITSSVNGTNVSYFDPTLTATGEHTITMHVQDAANNYGNLVSKDITIDPIAPIKAAIVTIESDQNNNGIIDSTEANGVTDVTVEIPSDAQDNDVIVVTNDLTGETIGTYTVGVNATAGETKTISNVGLPSDGETLTITSTIHDLAGNAGPTSSDSISNYNTAEHAPVVTIERSGLLGLIPVEALGLIDIDNQDVAAADPDNNLQEIVISYNAVLNISLEAENPMTVSEAMATELGLTVVRSTPQLLTLLGTSATLTITAADGGTIDNAKLNELLTTFEFDTSIVSAGVVSNLIIQATDSAGLTAEQSTDTALVDAGALANLLNTTQQTDSNIQEGTAGEDTLTGTSNADRLYGYDGNDTLSGLGDNDILRGGNGDDTLHGGDGKDLVDGGSDTDSLYGDAGDDVLVFDDDDSLIDGGTGVDTLYLTNATTDFDLSNVIHIEKIDMTEGDHILSLSYADLLAQQNTTDTLFITGNGGDSVDVTNQVFTGTETIDGITYNTYNIGGSDAADIWVQQDVAVI